MSGTGRVTMTKTLTHGSLFAGIGGFDLGFERAGIKTIWQVEIDKFCQRVLAKHFPEAKRFGDIKTVGAHNLETVDIITGGFPCQDLSGAQHGTRVGLAGDRSGLWYEFARIIDEFVPRWVVIENVPRLLTSNDGRDFTTIISRLVECGYGVCWRILDAKYFGVAGTRKRLFIVGCFADIRSANAILFGQDGIGALSERKQATRVIKPMCVGWDGGITLERLRQCILTETDAVGIGTSDGLSRRLDKYRYRALGNAIVPQIAEIIGKLIIEASDYD